MDKIDINFDVYSDTPEGKDPDSFSSTLRNYHKFLWSKPLPNNKEFYLNLDTPKLLHHKSALGEFFLSSDSIGHTYSRVKKMSHIIEQIGDAEINDFFSICSTIGAYIIFPAKRINNKMTINGARGVNHKIQDRFDLTLECIRRLYLNQQSPLTDVLERNATFFRLFSDFKGYVDYFLLQDLVEMDYEVIKFWSNFDNFETAPLPKDKNEYLSYKPELLDFIQARNQRILNSAINGE
ncbi:hypothetical protein OAS52_03515 [Gammaproteobacteria bacterium]|nr:hypothetical protein [Gammaproteobacteria bacterium]